MAEPDFISHLKEVGGVFRFGSGVLGKSAIALGVLLIAVIIAVSRLHSDAAILTTIILGIILFGGWFRYVLKFASDHPDVALLEGAEWSGYQRFQATAKGLLPSPADEKPTLSPGLETLPTVAEPKDQESK